MNKFFIQNFLCVIAFMEIIGSLSIPIPFLVYIALVVLYGYSNLNFMMYYRKNYRKFRIKYTLIAFFGGLYYLFKFRCLPNKVLVKAVREENQRGQ